MSNTVKKTKKTADKRVYPLRNSTTHRKARVGAVQHITHGGDTTCVSSSSDMVPFENGHLPKGWIIKICPFSGFNLLCLLCSHFI